MVTAAIRLEPKRAPLFVGRGSMHNATGDVRRALADLDLALRLDPKSVEAYAERGSACLLYIARYSSQGRTVVLRRFASLLASFVLLFAAALPASAQTRGPLVLAAASLFNQSSATASETTVLPTGATITPDAAPGSVFQPLTVDLPDYPNRAVDGAQFWHVSSERLSHPTTMCLPGNSFRCIRRRALPCQ